VLAVPLGQERITGVLTLTDEETDHFTPADLELLTSIASQATIAIDKAQAYLKEQLWARKLQFVSGVAHQVSSLLDPTRILEDVPWLIQETFDYYYVELVLRRGSELVLAGWNCCRGKGPLRTAARLPLDDESVVPWVARTGSPLLLADARQDPRYRPLPELPGTVAELAVPLEAAGDVVGVLDVQCDGRDQLGPRTFRSWGSWPRTLPSGWRMRGSSKRWNRSGGGSPPSSPVRADAIVATDAEMRLTLLNPAAEQAFGVRFAETVGRPLEEVLPYPVLYQAFAQAREEAGPTKPLELPLADGRTFFFTVSPVAGGPKGEGGWVRSCRISPTSRSSTA